MNGNDGNKGIKYGVDIKIPIGRDWGKPKEAKQHDPLTGKDVRNFFRDVGILGVVHVGLNLLDNKVDAIYRRAEASDDDAIRFRNRLKKFMRGTVYGHTISYAAQQKIDGKPWNEVFDGSAKVAASSFISTTGQFLLTTNFDSDWAYAYSRLTDLGSQVTNNLLEGNRWDYQFSLKPGPFEFHVFPRGKEGDVHDKFEFKVDMVGAAFFGVSSAVWIDRFDIENSLKLGTLVAEVNERGSGMVELLTGNHHKTDPTDPEKSRSIRGMYMPLLGNTIFMDRTNRPLERFDQEAHDIWAAGYRADAIAAGANYRPSGSYAGRYDITIRTPEEFDAFISGALRDEYDRQRENRYQESTEQFREWFEEAYAKWEESGSTRPFLYRSGSSSSSGHVEISVTTREELEEVLAGPLQEFYVKTYDKYYADRVIHHQGRYQQAYDRRPELQVDGWNEQRRLIDESNISLKNYDTEKEYQGVLGHEFIGHVMQAKHMEHYGKQVYRSINRPINEFRSWVGKKPVEELKHPTIPDWMSFSSLNTLPFWVTAKVQERVDGPKEYSDRYLEQEPIAWQMLYKYDQAPKRKDWREDSHATLQESLSQAGRDMHSAGITVGDGFQSTGINTGDHFNPLLPGSKGR